MAELSIRGYRHSRRGYLATYILIPLLMLGPTGLALASEEEPPESTSSSGVMVETDPVGAVVYLDGVERGVTPLSLEGVEPGEHRLTVHKESYLENTRVLNLKPGAEESVRVTLTEAEGAASYAMQIGGQEEGGDGPNWPLILGIAGGGAAATIFLLAGGNEPPTAMMSVTPTTGLASATSFRFSASGSTDPDGDSLTYSWNFGDGGSGSGQSTTHTYSSGGSFGAMLTVSDGEESATASSNVNVRTLSDTWAGDIAGVVNVTLNMTQSGTSLSGSYQDQFFSGTITGTINSESRVTITVRIPNIVPFELRGESISSDFDRISGRVFGSGFTGEPFSLSRR